MRRWRNTCFKAFAVVVLLAGTLPKSSAAAMDGAATPQALAESDSWAMSAANPQRTSHNSVEVPGNLSVEWYHVIDPYIDNKVQVIAADNKVFLSTSKGLYAFEAASGAQLWAYGTEMPLGNSPTYYNGIVYVGGFDHKIHAINASDGKLKAGWTFRDAGAGYDTNPLVVSDSYTGGQPVVFAGNRDGMFYALDGNTGVVKWKYPTGGPIHFSAAYKDGVVYFASNDAYAYALNAGTGALVWKSAKFPGVGFDAYWPVIYTDKETNKDYVIFSGSLKGAWMWLVSNVDTYHQPNYEMYNGVSGFCGPQGNEPYFWAAGTATLRCDTIFDYYNHNPKWNGQPPWTRFVFVLDRATGVEFTPYAPFNPSGHDGGGQGYKQPPIVGGDGVLYNRIGYASGGNAGANGGIAGWKFGTAFISRPHQGDWASDEPAAFTGGGNLIYYGEGSFNHEGFGTIDISRPLGSNGFWQWEGALRVPEASAKYVGLNLQGKFGGNNGPLTYMDGVLNHSPIPYQSKLYVVNGNVLYALSSAGGTKNLGLVTVPPNLLAPSLATTKADLQERLSSEIRGILAAGHLRPGFHDSGGWSGFTSLYFFPGLVPGNHLAEYFHNPADTLHALSIALPYLPTSLQDQVRAYLQQEQASYPVQTVASIGWKNGARREAYDDPPEMAVAVNGGDPYTSIDVLPTSSISYPNPCCGSFIDFGSFPADSFYGAWKYAEVFPNQAKPLFDAMKSKLPRATQVRAAGPGPFPGWASDADSILTSLPYILNQYIAGYRGYMELEKLAGYTQDISQSNQYAEYSRLLDLRITSFSENTPWGNDWDSNNALNVARNFMFMVPELAQALRDTRLPQVQQALAHYQVLVPYWFVSKYNRSYSESYSQPLYDYPALFQARAYVLQEPFEELVKYLDVPAFAVGDLFYIQNLVAALQAPSAAPGGTFVDVPPSHPYFEEIEALYQAGYTAGCNTSPLMYCPEATMNRAESAVFVERGIHTATYDPPTPTSQVFADLALDSWAAKWVSGLWQDQYTAGCGTNPLVYCPWQGHTRAEGCVFYLRMLNGPTYDPPAAGGQTFTDVPLDAWYAKWVKAGYDAGLIPACQTTPELRFCPSDPLTRALAAYMMVQAKGLGR